MYNFDNFFWKERSRNNSFPMTRRMPNYSDPYSLLRSQLNQLGINQNNNDIHEQERDMINPYTNNNNESNPYLKKTRFYNDFNIFEER